MRGSEAENITASVLLFQQKTIRQATTGRQQTDTVRQQSDIRQAVTQQADNWQTWLNNRQTTGRGLDHRQAQLDIRQTQLANRQTSVRHG